MTNSNINAARVKRNLLYAFLSLLAVFTVGTLGYHWLGDGEASWMDCFYMTFITIATIGFHEAVDVTHYEYGRLFTVFIGFSGIGVLGYTLSTMTAFMLESDLNESWRRKKMQKNIEQLRGHYIVCGIGFIGSNVVQELTATGRECVIVDPVMASIKVFLENNPQQAYVCGDATDDAVLLAAGIMNARGLFATVSDDSQNLMISLSAKQINHDLRVVARCHAPKNMAKTLKAGADEVVSPDYTGGLRIVSAMLRPNVVSFLDDMLKSDDNVRMEEVLIPATFAGKSLAELYEQDQDCLVLAIKQHDKWLFKPPSHQIMSTGDVLMVMISMEGRNRMEQLLAKGIQA